MHSALATHIPQSVALIRWDMLADRRVTDALTREARRDAVPLKKSVADIQPATTTVVDISRHEQEILMSMRPKTRYNIRLAERKGVQVTVVDRSRLGIWYALYRETARRDRITIHSLPYYRRLFSALNGNGRNSPKVELMLAKYGGRYISGIIVAYYGHGATYLYGASSNRNRNVMAPYLLQWTAMRRAQEIGCQRYDLFGIPLTDDPSHAMAGLYRFKIGFGGHIVERAGCWDWITRPAIAHVTRGIERARHVYYTRIRKMGRRI